MTNQKNCYCLYCDDEIDSESKVVFCDNECLKNYIADQKDLESFLYENMQREMMD